MRRWTTSLLVAAILGVLFYGCGWVTGYTNITYHPQINVNQIEEADKVAIKVKVADLRTENEVGIKGIAPIIADNDLRELIAHAIETELTNRGFKSGESVLIEADLIKFYNNSTCFGHITNLILHVDVKKPDGTLVYSNLVRGKGENKTFPIPFCPIVVNEVKVALDAALKDGISRLVNDPEFIKSLIKASVN